MVNPRPQVVLIHSPAVRSYGHFVGFPSRTLLEGGDLPIEELAQLALREGQATSPLYRVHRWFARRLSSQFRAILAALSLSAENADHFWTRYFGHIPLDHAIILDPFAGGGTSVVEASRCNARVIGYDIDPVATYITRFELESASWDRLPDSVEVIASEVSGQILPLHRTILPDGREADVLHHFWVEVTSCQECGREFEVHPHHLLAYSTTQKLQWVFCGACHEVEEQPLGSEHLSCACGSRTTVHHGTLSQGKLRCPECGAVHNLSARGRQTKRPPVWRLFAQEYLEPSFQGKVRKFKRATDCDHDSYREAELLLRELEAQEGTFAPQRIIPVVGRSDRRPLIHGFRRYRELFNARQLFHLTLLGRAISVMPDGKDKRLLGLAFSEHLTTNCIYVGYAFGYRRVCPLFSIHSYRHIVRPVELNPWLTRIGRGTFPNVLHKIKRAIQFAQFPSDLHPKGGRRLASRQVGPTDGAVGNHPGEVLRGEFQAVVRTQNSVSLSALPEGSVDLILTDPPYFDNLSYSELSDFYLVWHQALGIAERPYARANKSAPIRANLAVTVTTDEAITKYRRKLMVILRECWRVLHVRGVCVFTYHHKSVKAWYALGDALARSGLRVSSVLPLRGEGQGGLHSYDGTIKWDAVFVCRKAKEQPEGENGLVVIPKRAMKTAAQRTKTYRVRLAGTKQLGFRPPDQLNLYRAFAVAAARVAPLTPRSLLLEAALDLPFEC
jgi:adenine-specific DNA methylase